MAYIGRTPAYGSFEKQALTPNSSTTSFALNYVVGSTSSILVSVAGVVQEPEVAYNISGGGANIVFTAAPTTGDTAFIVFLGLTTQLATLATGSITSLTALGAEAAADDYLLLYDTSATALKKVLPENVLTKGAVTTLSALGAAAAADDYLLIYDTTATAIKKITTANLFDTQMTAAKYVTRSLTGNASTTTVTLTTGHTVDSVIVTENGIVQRPTTDYTISGTTLTFVTAPASGVVVRVKELLI